MIFGGLQKLTLLDFPGVVSCIVFTKGCNFLCPFCHNALLVNRAGEAQEIDEEEIISFLNKRKGVLEGVVITGGEPLLHPELENFIVRVRELGYKVKLDTNGSFPDRLKALVSKGLLDYVAMDIKNSFGKYPCTAGTDRVKIQDIEESIDFLLSGTVPYEFRTTVTSELHTTQDIVSIARRIEGAERYFLQNFKDSGDLVGQGNSPVSEEILEEMCTFAKNYVKYCEKR